MRLGQTCPICRKPSADAYDPFCSQACKTLDLHRWLQGVYAIPTNESPDSREQTAATEDDL